MKRMALVGVLVAFGFAVTGYTDEAAAPKAAPKAEVKAPAATMVYTCAKCETVALKAGKCEKCQGEMTGMRVLAVKDGQAICCPCGADCKCKLNADGAKCGCGKDVKKLSLKGMFVCADGKCTMISDKEGKCACGKDMKKVE